MLLINETIENISHTTCDGSALCSFSSKPQRLVQSTKGCLGRGKNKQLYFLPTGCSIQCVMEDQSLWPTGGLLQPLAEPHTNKQALGMLHSGNLVIYKRQNPCCAGVVPVIDNMYNYAFLLFKS